MKRIITVILAVTAVIIAAVAFAADPEAAPVVTAAAPAAPSLIAWGKANLAPILTVALSVSELLSLTPWFKGNGILDSIVKALKALLQKQDTGA